MSDISKYPRIIRHIDKLILADQSMSTFYDEYSSFNFVIKYKKIIQI